MPITPDDETLLTELPAGSRAAARIRALVAALDAAEAGTAGHAAAVEAAKAAGRAEAEATLTPQIELARAGISDPEGIDLALYLYGKQPAEGRPSLSEFVGTAKALAPYRPAAPSAVPAVAAPAPVAPAVGAVQTPTPAAVVTPAPVTAPIPAPNPNGGPPAPAGGGLTPAAIVGTRDWAKNRDAVFAQLDAGRK